MKKTLSVALVAIFAFVCNAFAQSPLVATLNHEGTITVYYGSNAFVNAHAAAVHGDAITLSSGAFMSTNITKAVSIHGAGMTTDSVTHMEPTILLNDFDLNVPDTTAHRLLMEGIYHDGQMKLRFSRNAQLLKCRFNEITHVDGTNTQPIDISFVHCRIAGYVNMTVGASANFLNSVVTKVAQYGGNSYNKVPFIFTNCFVGTCDCVYSEYRNCVLLYNASPYSSAAFLGGRNSVYNNNILITNNGYGQLGVNNYNKTIKKENAGDLAGDYSDLKSYILPDNVKNLIKGTDGTEVGIYGGSFPYDPTPSNPQITKFSVDKKSTADGKLNVVVEINGAK